MIRICRTRYQCASCGAAIEDWQHKHCEACNTCACSLCLTLGPDREWYCPGDCEPLDEERKPPGDPPAYLG